MSRKKIKIGDYVKINERAWGNEGNHPIWLEYGVWKIGPHPRPDTLDSDYLYATAVFDPKVFLYFKPNEIRLASRLERMEALLGGHVKEAA